MDSDPTGLVFGVMGMGILMVVGVFVLAIVAFWVWMLVDCIQHEFSPQEQNAKIVWILVIIFAGWIGGLIYFFVVKKGVVNKPNLGPRIPPGNAL